MDMEEKYQEIASQRESKGGTETARAEEPKAAEEAAPQNAPAAEEKAESGDEGSEANPKKEEAKEGKSDDGGLERYKSEAERSRHAMARMRKQHAAEKADWERKFKELEAKVAPQKPKTREDFGSDEEWREHLEKAIEDKIVARVMEGLNKRQAEERGVSGAISDLHTSVSNFLGKEDGEKVWRELTTEGTEAYEILNDPRSDHMVSVICDSPMKGALLGAIVYSPRVFRNILDLPQSRQAYELYRVEERIRSNQAEIARKKEQAKKREESLPAPGTFGNNAKGSTDISGLSTKQRVERYKKELLDNRTF